MLITPLQVLGVLAVRQRTLVQRNTGLKSCLLPMLPSVCAVEGAWVGSDDVAASAGAVPAGSAFTTAGDLPGFDGLGLSAWLCPAFETSTVMVRSVKNLLFMRDLPFSLAQVFVTYLFAIHLDRSCNCFMLAPGITAVVLPAVMAVMTVIVIMSHAIAEQYCTSSLLQTAKHKHKH